MNCPPYPPPARRPAFLHAHAQAFYLAHVDECVGLELALATPRVVVPTAGATTLLPSPTRRKRHLDDEHPRLPHCHQQGQYDDGDDAGGGPTTFKEAGVGCDLIPSGGISGGGSGCTDADNVGGGGSASPSLSIDEAWRYCCDRRSDFPAMFAVYRHFRARGYVCWPRHLFSGGMFRCRSKIIALYPFMYQNRCHRQESNTAVILYKGTFFSHCSSSSSSSPVAGGSLRRKSRCSWYETPSSVLILLLRSVHNSRPDLATDRVVS